MEELKQANTEARPGDVIVLQNGEWNNVKITLNCKGTKTNPILFKAETPGKVIITGQSKLQFGGSFIVVDGLYFTNGFADEDAVISFRIDKNELANNCRLTNTVINDFNNEKRLDENYWVAFYGKNNRIDHCSFVNKKNMGVLLAVILDDERSRENFHSIDHNYFGKRPPLASNGGEIIRVGVSQHATFNSNTQITDNYFEHCDGEAEIVSIKSGGNVVRNNLFKESQGSVVLRHGDNNTVENNIFFGNNKAGTGGVRVINKGQWVVNNYFYKCRGTDFRSPLAIMNGIPNSPAHRYVQVTDAVIFGNTFQNCSAISFGEGSDAERSLPPANVAMANNLFYNKTDSVIYKAYDDVSGIKFLNNQVSKEVVQNVTKGFIKTTFVVQKNDVNPFPVAVNKSVYAPSDSLQKMARQRLGHVLLHTTGFTNLTLAKKIQGTAWQSGAGWLKTVNKPVTKKPVSVNCFSVNEIAAAIEKNKGANITINLTGTEYNFTTPLIISSNVVLTSPRKDMVKWSSSSAFGIMIEAGKSLSLDNLTLDLSALNATTFITTDTSGSSQHSNFSMTDCSFDNYNGTFFNAAKTSVADSIVIKDCWFNKGSGLLFNFSNEDDKKGYYNVEKLSVTSNNFSNYNGQLLAMLRGGNDESTMGPQLVFSSNKISNCASKKNEPLISLYGTQRSFINGNGFTNSNTGKSLIVFEDVVKAAHFFTKNKLINSGAVEANKFVVADDVKVK
ncbi:MAG: polysaccharide lyase 6 family protein [Bacteroidota bacterium]